MFKNYIKIAIRTLQKHRGYSLINIVGLGIGMACCILILLWVQDELSFDKFHTNYDTIYRVLTQGSEDPFFGSPAPLAPAIEQQLSEIIETARYYGLPQFVFEYNGRSFYENHGIVVDPGFFDMFSFPLVKGSFESAFATPEHIVITESMARKYFGDKDPINKAINIEGEGLLIVGGVLKDLPANSHIQFDYALPYSFLEDVKLCGLKWGDFNFKTYIRLASLTNMADVNKKITGIAIDNKCPQIKYGNMHFYLQSLHDMYLHPQGKYDIPLGNIKFIYIFSTIALFILCIACFNSFNLSTARALTRAREVGVRKVMGARRRQIINQFWGEFMLLALLALLVALMFAQACIPVFNSLTGKNLSLHLLHPSFLFTILGIMLFGGFIAGIYPAILLSAFQPATVLQKYRMTGMHSPYLRRLLVIAQFALSILLIICTLVVSRQMQFIRNKSWNMQRGVVVHIPIKENIGIKYDVVKSQLLQHPRIMSVGAKDRLPTILNNNTTGVWWEGKADALSGIHFETIRVDHDYFTTVGIDLLEGRYFSKNHTSDNELAYILNEEAVRQAKLTDPIGKWCSLYGRKGTIIGVVNDSYYQSLRQPIRPQLYYLFTDMPRQGFFGTVLIRIAVSKNHAELQDVLTHIKTVWNSVNQLAPFEYHFLDETIEAQYNSEQRLMKLFSVFAALAIFISCLGLFGLATFIAERRIKEIGIRKVLGSSDGSIVILLSRSFAIWILIANLIAWPIGWYVMNQWLSHFAYHMTIQWWIFIVSALIVFTIALLTIGYKTVRVATANPVEALRYE